MNDLELYRDLIKNVKSLEELEEFVDANQREGIRICPLNMICDEKSKQICNVKQGNADCRKRIFTCWKKYIKEK